MRKMALSLLPLAALALASCNAPSSSSSPPSTGDAPASTGSAAVTKVANEVSGTVSLRSPGQPLSPKASLVITLTDVSSTADAGAAPLATKTVAPVTQFPQSFTLSFDTTQVKPANTYVVRAVLIDGDRHYTMPIQAPVLTNGSKNDGIAIELVAQQTAGEKAMVEFSNVQKQLGAMKVSHGTKLDPDASRGWQVFRQNGELKFIRELVDYGAKGFTSTDYAYKDGKPWVVVQQTKPNQGAKTSATDRAGWDDNGNLVLKKHDVNGDVQVLDDSAAGNLQKQSLAVLSLATGGKNK